MKRVLVTGASGFVGSILCGLLSESGYLVRAAVRDGAPIPPEAKEHCVIGNLGSSLPWGRALCGVDMVVHLAARAHILKDSPANAGLYFEANALATHNLARQAADAKVDRFVYLSSIKVNGDATTGRAFTRDDEPRPCDAYGLSKWEGEKLALKVATESGMRVSIVRPPLIYGPGVKANFLRLMQWIDAERFLPLGSVENARSLVSVWNVGDLIVTLLRASRPDGVWMVSDGVDMSTPDLIRKIALAMRRRARLLPIPVTLLRAGATAIGYRAHVARLCGSLVIDISATRSDLEWTPPVSVAEGLLRTCRWYLSRGTIDA